MNTYYIKHNNQDQGPYTLDQLTAMWKQGSITADAVYRIGAEGSFLPIASLLTPNILGGNASKLAAFEKPNIFIRGIAALIDFIGMWIGACIAGGIFIIFGKIFGSFLKDAETIFSTLGTLAGFAVILFFCVFKDGFSGRSPGKLCFGLIAISPKTLKPCGFGRSFIRNFIMVLYFVPVLGWLGFFIDIILILAREDGRGLHDLGAETHILFYKDFKTLKEA